MKKIKLVEIARSFSRKINLGNYETADFFCSEKAEVPEKDAEKTSEALYSFCESEVMKSVADFQLNKIPPKQPPKLTGKDFAIAKAEAPKSQANQDLATEIGGENKLKEDNEREGNELSQIATELNR